MKEAKTKHFLAWSPRPPAMRGRPSSSARALSRKTYLAARNVKNTLLARAADVNTEQLLAFDKVILTKDALSNSLRKARLMKEAFDQIQTVILH